MTIGYEDPNERNNKNFVKKWEWLFDNFTCGSWGLTRFGEHFKDKHQLELQ